MVVVRISTDSNKKVMQDGSSILPISTKNTDKLSVRFIDPSNLMDYRVEIILLVFYVNVLCKASVFLTGMTWSRLCSEY